eukprot:SAG22_NODE_514_length_9568_cov_10.711902_2_plen_61_part_00
MDILLAIKMMVADAAKFVPGAIGFDGRGVDRIQLPRLGACLTEALSCPPCFAARCTSLWP